MAEHEGFLDLEESAIVEPCEVADGLIGDVTRLVGKQSRWLREEGKANPPCSPFSKGETCK